MSRFPADVTELLGLLPRFRPPCLMRALALASTLSLSLQSLAFAGVVARSLVIGAILRWFPFVFFNEFCDFFYRLRIRGLSAIDIVVQRDDLVDSLLPGELDRRCVPPYR